jgi:hypothetical protein
MIDMQDLVTRLAGEFEAAIIDDHRFWEHRGEFAACQGRLCVAARALIAEAKAVGQGAGGSDWAEMMQPYLEEGKQALDEMLQGAGEPAEAWRVERHDNYGKVADYGVTDGTYHILLYRGRTETDEDCERMAEQHVCYLNRALEQRQPNAEGDLGRTDWRTLYEERTKQVEALQARIEDLETAIRDFMGDHIWHTPDCVRLENSAGLGAPCIVFVVQPSSQP